MTRTGDTWCTVQKQWRNDGFREEWWNRIAGQIIQRVTRPADGGEERVEPKITWYGQSTVGIEFGGVRIVIDPFRIPAGQPEADVILLSHHHPGHLSPVDIARVFREHTVVYASTRAAERLDRSLNAQRLVAGDVIHHGPLTIQAVAAYNVNKFRHPGVLVHPPESQGLGFVIDIDDLSFYFAGDTDVIPEMDQIGPVDYAFLPVGGGSVMTAEEAAQAATVVQPSIAIPIHYGGPTGSLEGARRFSNLVPDQVRVWIMTPPSDSSDLQPEN